jgi:hypothetical protein
MLFNMETDTGDRVTGYFVPDGYSEVPSIRLRSEGGEVLSLAANEIREALVVAGRHETGQCGFSVGTELIPNIRHMTDLEICDADTGLLIYRRRGRSASRRKSFGWSRTCFRFGGSMMRSNPDFSISRRESRTTVEKP